MGVFDFLKKKKQNDETQAGTVASGEYLDDITYVRAIKSFKQGPWVQYDILIAAQGYGWATMINWADYAAQADLVNVSQVTVSDLNSPEKDITAEYTAFGKCTGLAELEEERGVLSIAGISTTLKAPMKIVWINQTKALRFFTVVDDEPLVRKYAETLIRRTFGTADAMKLGKPIPEGQ